MSIGTWKKRIAAGAVAAMTAFSLTACGFPWSILNIPEILEGVQGTTPGSPQGGAWEEPSGKPAQWKDSDLKEVMKSSPNVTEVDDFNLAVNREWSLANDIPEGYDRYDLFVERQLQVYDEIMALLQDSSPYKEAELEHDRQVTQNYYALWLDWDHRNELGVQPLKDLMAPLLEVETLDELTEYLSREETAISATQLAKCYAMTNWNDTDHYIVYIDPMDVIFGDSMYYQMMDYDDWKEEPFYDEMLRYILVRMGYSDSEATDILAGCFSFEKDAAEYMMTTEELNAEDSVQKQNNVFVIEEVERLAGDFPIRGILRAFGAEESNEFIVCEPDWLDVMGDLYTEENLERIKDYLLVYTAQDYATLLDRKTYDKYWDVLNGLHGSTGVVPDTQAAAEAVDRFLPMQLGRLYAEKYIEDGTIGEITEVAKEILAQYRVMLEGEEFLSEATREEAIRKLDKIRLHIAAPQVWEDDSKLYVSSPSEGGNLFRAQDEIGGYLIEDQKTKINGTVDHSYWTSSPQDVNAYYDPTENSVTICAGILGGAFYDTDMSREEVFATAGDTLAHEISHAFDSSGCHFDEKGNLRDWWTAEDYTAFRQRADKLVAYYDEITPISGMHCSGILLQAEAIADLVAMKTMLALAAGDSGFDYKLFFETYAGTWRNISTIENEYYAIMQDSHPLAYLRTNVVVQQFQEFHDTFGVKNGDGMYLVPQDRLEVW